MTRSRLPALSLTLGLSLVACISTQSQPTISISADQETVESTNESPSTIVEARRVETVDCDQAPEDVAILCEAYDLIRTRYVDDINDTALAEAAESGLEDLDGSSSMEPLTCPLPADEFTKPCDVAGSQAETSAEAAESMVAGLAAYGLDPNSAYFDVDALQLLEEEQQGEIEGIGALVSPEDASIEGDNKQCNVVSDTCRILIISTIEGAPAEDVGLIRDDVIVAVDGRDIKGLTVDEVTSQVRGPAGSPVVLTIERNGEHFDVSIVRAAVVIPVIDFDRFGRAGYIQLRVFSYNADEQFEAALLDLLGQGIDSLVVDLRDNPGGLLDTAIEVTSIFLPDGEVVVTESPDDRRSYEVSGAVLVPDDLEIVFVVNKASASASEVVSAVLQERSRATVVGENTFGKNTVQQRFRLSNGGALKLTVARWLTPGGLDFGGVGVTPDVKMDLASDMEAAAVVEAVLGAA